MVFISSNLFAAEQVVLQLKWEHQFQFAWYYAAKWQGFYEDEGLDVEIKVNDMAGWRSSKTYAETVSWSKVLIEKGSGQIIGAHLVGHGAEEIIHLFAFALKHGVPARELAGGLYAYPTFSSDLKFMV